MAQFTSIELSHLERFSDGWGFRVNGHEWSECGGFAGFTPASDSITDLQAAVVAIAHAHDLTISEDVVAVNGLNAFYCPL